MLQSSVFKINVSKIFKIVEQKYKAELKTSRYRSIVVISSGLCQFQNYIMHQAPFAAINAGHKAKSEFADNWSHLKPDETFSIMINNTFTEKR